ncbi:response regulator transcription factor [Paenibacillus piri]|uniref:Response regulator n=1 Tax=Paenibacillus piri TaxID=2547395 RepID=A0A4R5KD95_9BACL|nr:response regulator [Paenibacillus piri]TDF93261.1 response regulator [Paenibacillus piri]
MFRVLVAEDELWIRDALTEMVEKLAPQFHAAGEAGNGEEAWSFIQEQWPSIVITDIMMPHRDGLWLSEQIHTLNLPIVTIIVSGYDNFHYAKQAMRYGITEYLLKPVDEEELHGALRRSMKRLESMSDFHEGVIRIQKFVEQLPEMDQQTLLQESQSLVAYILKLKATAPGKRTGLLAILSAKLNELFQAFIPQHAYAPLTDESEQGVRGYFSGLMDAWLLLYPQQADPNVHSSIKRVCEYIDTHYYENFTLARLAEMSYMSVSHFSMLFKKTTGQTCLNYINQIRIHRAKKLLQEPDLKIYEIADMVGYSSMPYFNRIFKQLVMITPAEYRRRMGL